MRLTLILIYVCIINFYFYEQSEVYFIGRHKINHTVGHNEIDHAIGK